MAYRPTNDVKENVIHRNTIFDSQGMVSCCTCGHCINKTEDATLTLTNFKKADPLFNEQSIGSTIVEFSDYMIPTGSFDYVLAPYSTTNLFIDNANVSNEKFADSLVYYPFLKCNGVTTSEPNNIYSGINWPYPENIDGVLEKTQKPYGASFAVPQTEYDPDKYNVSTNGLQQNPFNTGYWNVNFVTSLTGIGFDSQFGSFAYSNAPYIQYTNTSITSTFYNANYCYFCTNNPNDYYKWGLTGNYDYLLKSFFIEQKNYFGFSQKYNFNLESILTNGITQNFANFVSLNNYSYFQFNYFVLNQIDFSNFKDKDYYSINELNKKLDDFNWISPGIDYPCNQNQLQNIAQSNGNFYSYDTNNILTPKVYPTTLDLGNYQTYFNYLDSHDFCHLGFNENATCQNNIIKIMSPVYFQSFDDHVFSNQHSDYTKANSVFGITDKFIVPDFQSWSDCISTTTSPPIVTPLAAKTVQFKEMNSTNSILKNGYVLDKFELNKNGTFNATMSIVYKNDFFAIGLNSTWYLQKSQIFDGVNSCSYFWNRWTNDVNPVNVSPPFIHANFTQPLLWNGTFISATATTYIDYSNQVETYFYTNGSFNSYSAGMPVTYYEDVCRGYIQTPYSLALPVSYVAQKTDRTKIESITDSTGRTTTTIKNVLWVGKTLLTETYTHNDGVNRPKTAGGQVPLNYDAILKGGFESDIIVSYQSTPICSINNIADRMNRVTKFKMNFENYQKIPQLNFTSYDYVKNIIDSTPDAPQNYIYSFNYDSNELSNICFAPPNVNQNDYFYIKRVNLLNSDWNFEKDIQEVAPYQKTVSYYPGRAYHNFGVPDRFKGCVLVNGDESVWQTGNEVKLGTSPTVYYSIFMEEIKDHKQTAGQSLVRLALTPQDAIDGIYIPYIGLQQMTVKFMYNRKNYSDVFVSYSAPGYKDFDLNSISTSNKNADDRNINYTVSGTFLNSPFTSPMYMTFKSNKTNNNYPAKEYPEISFVDGTKPLPGIGFYGYDKLEVISLSPLKIKYINMKFSSSALLGFDKKTYNFQFYPPNGETVQNISANCYYGFMCDLVMEEVVDEFIQEALPVEFNQILENVEYIQTSNLMNARKPLQMINPEKCEHIGKVIDRKDCNCPKKWIRECELHGKTDWKKCMTCKDFKLSE